MQVEHSESGKVLLNTKIDLKDRFRALFSLRNTLEDSSVEFISKVLTDDSELLAHEAAYCLGQMRLPSAIDILKKTVSDLNQRMVVRHEAAEALAAIGDPSLLEFLEKYSNDPQIEVAESCQIAADRVRYYLTASHEKDNYSPFHSVDPAPPYPSEDVSFLKDLLLDDSKPLFDRYRAMFSLRNIGSPEAVEGLTRGFCSSGSLFKHEIAFVLGQMQPESSIDALIKVVDDEEESPMVRHEAAEALGNIATPECIKYLTKRLSDKDRIVRESCYVALDIADYQNSDNFQYAYE